MKKLCLVVVIFLVSCTTTTPEFKLEEQQSNTENLLIGLHAIDEKVVWISGTGSTILRTLDGGNNWQPFQYEETDSLQFRDVYGLSQDEAIVLSAGEGFLSKIFRFSADEGWMQTYQMTDSLGFLDGVDFWNDTLGLAYGDAIDHLPFILKTTDGGVNWHRLVKNLPEAGQGEGGFAASGTLIEMAANGEAWIGTGAGGNARILHTHDFGDTWQAMATPMVKGEAAGITSVRKSNHILLIAGGNIAVTNGQKDNIFLSMNNGISWKATTPPPLQSAIYGSAFTIVEDQKYVLVCGPSGAAVSTNMGKGWTMLLENDLWSCELLPVGTGWIVGRNGRIVKISADL